MSGSWTYTKGEKPVTFSRELPSEDGLKDKFEEFLKTEKLKEHAIVLENPITGEDDRFVCGCSECCGK